MNDWQILRQLQYLLRAREWTTNVPIFASGSVVISTGNMQPGAHERLMMPVALVAPTVGRNDPQEPSLIQQDYEMIVLTANPNDPFGEAALVGANRTGQQASPGKGLLEICEEAVAAIGDLNDLDGVRIVVHGSEAGPSGFVENVGFVAQRRYTMGALHATSRFYHPARNFEVSESGGTVTLTWDVPPDRFDRRQMVVRRGSSQPTGPTDGTGITLSGDLATTVNDTPGAGTWHYGIWAAYDEYGSSSNERFSDPLYVSVTV